MTFLLRRFFPQIDLTVRTPLFKPTLSVNLNETIKGQKVFQIVCIVKSSQKANVSFTRLEQTLTASEEHQITMKSSADGETVTYTMTFQKVTYRNAGEYYCRAQNGVRRENVVVGVIKLQG